MIFGYFLGSPYPAGYSGVLSKLPNVVSPLLPADVIKIPPAFPKFSIASACDLLGEAKISLPLESVYP